MSDLYANLTARLSEARSAHKAPGASLAIWDGARMHTAVAGVRNSVTGDPVTPDTLMHIGSITKIFNATLVMQLLDDGLIALDDLVIKHLPELRLADQDALGRITCRMLLNHTSGIDGMILPDHGPDRERVEDFIARCGALEQLHAPGGGPSYCNAAVVIAGYLVQRLRGVSWYTLVRERILAPLGLAQSLVDLTDLPRFRVSVGDVTDPASGKLVQSTRPFLPISFAPAGATMMTSAEDLVNFARAHLLGGIGANGTRILSERSTRLMQQRTADVIEPADWGWGLGWMLLPGGIVSHGGGGPGVNSILYLHPESGRAAAMLTNSDQGAALYTAFLGPILQNWTGQTAATAAPASGAPVTVDPAPYVGRYQNNMVTIEIVELDGGLGIRVAFGAKMYDNQSTEMTPPSPLQALGNHAFLDQRQSAMGGTVRFTAPDASGKCQAIGSHVHLYVRRDPA